ncbi:unnamed protein product [Aspergillus oryzae]|nr:unnamed protein product [Aspergillus oryzae]GMF91024.1 unnamed protein product [Aspergillus oryzae]GMG16746.1 unnamed protein product [Aspergillus oryzae]
MICAVAQLPYPAEFGYSLKAPGLESCAAASYELMQDVIGELVYASENFAAQITPADLEVLPVFVVHSVYKAARLLLGVLRDSPKVDSRRAVSVLERVLQYRRPLAEHLPKFCIKFDYTQVTTDRHEATENTTASTLQSSLGVWIKISSSILSFIHGYAKGAGCCVVECTANAKKPARFVLWTNYPSLDVLIRYR